MTTEARVRALPPLRFQALALILLRREFGDALEDVRDTAGEGNGCDGILVCDDHVEGFQVRTVEREFGDTQKRKARAAVDLALTAIPKERGLPLTKFMFVLNLDLQPSEAAWFADQKTKYAQQGCTVTHRTLGWVVSQLLDERNAGVRREFVESEADRQLEILRAIAGGGQTSAEALGKILALVQGLGASEDAKRALETLLERAQHHFNAGIERLAEESFRAAVTALAEAKELLKRHHDDPLYVDVVYWHAIAQYFANDWSGALIGFQEAEYLYRKVGREDEALWAQGNQGHALRGLARHKEALETFKKANAQWLAKNDVYNILTGHLNEAEIQMELGDLKSAGGSFQAAHKLINSLDAPDIVRLNLFEVILHFFGSFSTFYFALENDDAALGCLENAIDWARKGKAKLFLAKSLAGCVVPLAFKGNLAEAVVRATEAEQLFNEVGDRSSLGRLYNNLGVAHAVHNELKKACEYLRRDYEICIELGDKAGAQKTLDSMRQFGCAAPTQ